jgi:hypothetical protein
MTVAESIATGASKSSPGLTAAAPAVTTKSQEAKPTAKRKALKV